MLCPPMIGKFDGDGGTSYILAASLVDNVFGNRRIELFGGGYITRLLFYDGNEQNYDQCVEDVLTPESGSPDISLLKSWIYNGNLYSYEDFGGFTNLSAAVLHLAPLDETHGFVQFDLDLGNGNDNREIVDVVVRFGDSACNEGTTPACYNSSTGKWNAEFNVTGWNPNFYWRPEATICDTTRVGACTLKQYGVVPSGDEPPGWYNCQ